MSANARKRDTPPASLAWARGPRIRELNARDRVIVLSRNHVGRLAFMSEGRIELLPVHYVFVDGAIVGRTSLGTKYMGWLVRDQVVFEVDESDGLFDWRSVVVRGMVTILRPRGPEPERSAHRRAVAAIRTLIPDAFTERDPTPSRGVVFAITPLAITGRMASTHDGPSAQGAA